ncbi:MAG: hypothetical protein J7K87_03925 [Candidatus Aenigmarchaeota archaeon]|nr:hypothetical protein [Candidatus Aenigmarchaeota archaeon]
MNPVTNYLQARKKVLDLATGYPVATGEIIEIPKDELQEVSVPEGIIPGVWGKTWRWGLYLIAERKDAIRPNGDPIVIELTPKEWKEIVKKGGKNESDNSKKK